MKAHYIKSETKNFKAVARGDKCFEVRKNDRGYSVGDLVYMCEFANGDYVANENEKCLIIGPFEIRYIFHGGQYGLAEDHCIFNW